MHPNREALAGFVFGTVPEEQADRIADHVDTCPQCEDTVRELETGADEVLHTLRQPTLVTPFEQEAACHQLLAVVDAIGREPSYAAADQAAAAEPPDLGTIRDYRLLAKLGEGGMGAVYKALHTQLDKIVALKVLPAERMRDAQAVARFKREMKAVGRLSHEHIVGAHDAGEHQGTHFLVMEYVDGIDLAQLVERLGALPVADACELIRQAALGLQHAHEHGLVHRDIKPSNLMVARVEGPESRVQSRNASAKPGGPVRLSTLDPRPSTLKILDLGLALLDAEAANGGEMTGSGQAMGTCDYMAPEQSTDAHHVDIRADIYGLGCTLYKLLTGHAPFSGREFPNNMAKLLAHVQRPVPPVRGHRPEVPEALAAVLDRMLAKQPEQRFATPAEVAAALEPLARDSDLRWLIERAEQDDPSAAPAAIAGTSTLPFASSADVGTESGPCVARPESAKGVAEVTGRRTTPFEDSGRATQDAPISSPPSAAPRRWQRWAVAIGLLFVLIGFGIWAALPGKVVRVKDKDGNVIAEVKVPADGSVEVTDEGGKAPPGKPATPATPARPSAAEQEIVPGILPRPAKLPGIGRWNVDTARPRGQILSACWSPDGRMIACGMATGHIRIYDATTLKLVRIIDSRTKSVSDVAWSPDGTRLASVGHPDQMLRIWSAEGTPIASVPSAGEELAWHPSGEWFAVRLGWEINLINLKGERRMLQVKGVQFHRPAWSPDGQWLAVPCNDGAVRLWRRDGTPGPTMKGHEKDIWAVTWSPDSARLADAGKYDHKLEVWDLEGKIQHTVDAQATSGFSSIAWSHDGSRLVAGNEWGQAFVCRLDDAQGQTIAAHLPLYGPGKVAASPKEDKFLSVGGRDGHLQLWTFDGKPIGSVLGTPIVTSADCSQDGTIASGGEDKRVRFWQTDGQLTRSIEAHKAFVTSVAWRPDGSALASSDGTGETYIHGTDGDPKRASLIGGAPGPHRLRWSRNGDRLASCGESLLVLWDPTGKKLQERESTGCCDFSWSCDDQSIAFVTPGGSRLWGPKTDQISRLDDKWNAAVAWRPGGAGMVFGHGRDLILADDSGEQERVLQLAYRGFNVTDNIVGISWHPGGEKLLAARGTGEIAVCSREGKLLTSVWDHRVTQHNGIPPVCCWTRDGRQFVTAAFDGTLRYYNAEPVEPVWVAVNLPEGKAVTFSPAGQILHGDPATVDSELVYLVENAQGALDLLTPADFRRRLAAVQPKPEPAPAADGKNYQLEFTGGPCYVETPVKYDGSHPITLEAFVTRPETTIAYRHVIGNYGESGGVCLQIHPTGSWSLGIKQGVTWANESCEKETPFARHHVAVVYAGKRPVFFVDGRRQETHQDMGENYDYQNSEQPFRLGVLPNCPNNIFEGWIDEVRISRIARYDGDFKPQPRFESDQETLALYHFDEGRGDIAHDASANANHGKVVGPRWVEVGTEVNPLPGLIAGPKPLPDGRRWQMQTVVPRTASRSVAWSPDGKLIAVGAGDGQGIFISDVATRSLVATARHDAYFVDLAWSPDGQRLASGARGAIRVFERDGTPVSTFRGIAWLFNHRVAWSPDGKRLACADPGNKQVRICDPNGENPTILQGHTGEVWDAAWSPDGQWVASASADKTVRLWKASGEPGPVLEGHAGSVGAVAWHPQGLWIASAGRDKTVRLWKPDGKPGPVLEGHPGLVHDVSWSPDGKWLASCGEEGIVRLWSPDGTAGSVFRTKGTNWSVTWSPDSRQLATADDSYLGPQLLQLDVTETRPLCDPRVPTLGTAWSLDGKSLAVGGGATLYLFGHDGTRSGARDFDSWIDALAWHHAGERLAVGAGKNAYVCDREGKAERRLEGHKGWIWSIGWTPDGQQLATGDVNGQVRIWNAEGSAGPVVEVGKKPIKTAAWSPDGKWLLTADESNQVRLWKPDGQPGPTVETRGSSAAWSPDGTSFLARVGDGLGIWDTAGKFLGALEGKAGGTPHVPGAFAWCPDGQIGATHLGTIVRWQADRTRSPDLKSFALTAHLFNGARTLRWQPGGRRLTTVGDDAMIVHWNTETRDVEWTAVLLSGGQSVTFSPAGQIVDGDPAVIEKQLVYLVERPTGGVDVLKPSDFAVLQSLLGK